MYVAGGRVLDDPIRLAEVLRLARSGELLGFSNSLHAFGFLALLIERCS
jgi:hypothetical protein